MEMIMLLIIMCLLFMPLILKDAELLKIIIYMILSVIVLMVFTKLLELCIVQTISDQMDIIFDNALNH